jgi:Resolvase, N terminal domain
MQCRINLIRETRAVSDEGFCHQSGRQQNQPLASRRSQTQEYRSFFGYTRVSTDDQNLDLQRAALTAAGCAKIFEDKITGTAQKRAGLARAEGLLCFGLDHQVFLPNRAPGSLALLSYQDK